MRRGLAEPTFARRWALPAMLFLIVLVMSLLLWHSHRRFKIQRAINAARNGHPAASAVWDVDSVGILSCGLALSTVIAIAAVQVSRYRWAVVRRMAQHSSALDRLYEQACRDAEARTMLLRELNHRVKNNMSGITALLSMAPPDLPVTARQWLERSINRIGTMARAHELFSDGTEKIALAELIQRMLPSLSVVKPPGVRIRTVLDDVPVRLKTDRAVCLSMVLHELCCNAIVHGVGESGTITVCAQLAGGSLLKIEVADDGMGMQGLVDYKDPPPMPHRRTAAGSTGIGLHLVAGLVARELKGRFTISSHPAGGTIAAVEFPLDAEEASGEVP